MPRLLVISIAATLLALSAAVVAPGSAAAPSGAGCSSATHGSQGYAYAGFQHAARTHGVRATLTSRIETSVAQGHVAAWVGVGGPGQGPNGTNLWLQVGLATFPGSSGNLYYEVALPGEAPVFKLVEANVPAGAVRRVAVLEMGGRPNWWRVWAEGRPVSEPIHLPGSSRRWAPIATAEAWDGGAGVCNRFSFRFDRLEVAASRGGSWKRFRSGFRFQDHGYRVQLETQRRSGTRRTASAAGATSMVAASVG